MVKLWLPLGAAPRHAVRDEREELMQRLRDIGVAVPGAAELEVQQLRDLVQWQEERAEADRRAALLRPAHRPKTLSREEVLIGLREYYHDYVVPHREGRKKFY
jgi:hypothetical protein